MTAEIVLMNKSAVAMAADSAVTVSNGNSDKKVFNTASKVFTLSKYAPVGVMIYSGASFCGVPWETIIKDYRGALGKKKFSSLIEYKNNFFEYIEKNDRFFTNDVKKSSLGANIVQLLIQLGDRWELISNNKTAKKILDAEIEKLSKLKFLDGYDDAAVRSFTNDNQELIDDIGKKIFDANKISCAGCKVRVRKYVSLYYLKHLDFPSYSGVVISGFGEDDAFPALHSTNVSGFLFDKVRASQCRFSNITNENQSDILPYAQTQMMDSVLLGVMPSYQFDVLNKFIRVLYNLPNEIIDGISELTSEQKAKYKVARASAGLSLLKKTMSEFNGLQQDRLKPMKAAISVMPKSELSIVAEVFVNVAQLEHRLSLDAETVGGPVDVAVISKGDGFVWIKRKHYFESSLNPGFVENYYGKDYI